MKKVIAILAAAAMLAVMLTACGKDTSKQQTAANAEATENAAEAATDAAEEAADAAQDAAEAEGKAAEAEAETVPYEDGTYTAEVTMEGGAGKASIQSPATVIVKGGKATAVITWSSDKYDYMIVDGEKYEPITTEGGSKFKIPVKVFDEPMTVIGDTTAMSQPHEIEYTLTFGSVSPIANLDSELAADKNKPAGDDAAAEETADEASAEETGEPEEKAPAAEEEPVEEAPAAALEDGVYLADFDTDSTMFRVNEACDGKGTLTVKDGEMTIHISLVSKKILNLFPGLAEDAEKDGAVLLEPTVDPVTYSDGYTEDVYGFDVPVPSLNEEFDLALIGEKGKWYDHKVSVSNPVPVEETGEE